MCRALVGLWERCGSEDEKLEEMGEGCFMSRKGEGSSGGKSGKSTGCTICLTEMKELAQALWVKHSAIEGGLWTKVRLSFS